ncbi:MAG: CCA tRNA nucleotidyltransferase [Candidatus Omnitrophota bacterium]|nr:MAG: CCA tRNA nucleotidyltransferase [Candidatus Omnitrophota bacterium]
MYLNDYLKKIPYLSLLSLLAKKQKINVWLVGGILRDAQLRRKKEFLDFDFCVEKNVFSFVKDFSKKISSKYIILDERQGSFRVIVKRNSKVYTYDFTRIRGRDLCEDLILRDFSINTLAINLNDKKKKIIDYFGARGDLKRKTIRAIKEKVLFDDPLRILRGFTFTAQYNFTIEPSTLKAMAKYKKFLHNVSGERVTEELFKIFASDYSYKVFMLMDRLKIIDEIIPYIQKSRAVSQGPYHHLGVWKHSLETLRKFELLYQRRFRNNKDIFTYLHEELVQARKRIQIIKLACLLHDIGKPFAKKRLRKKTIFHTHEKIGRDLVEKLSCRLRLSFREKEVLKRLVYWHLRPGYLADQKVPSQRAIYRFFRDTETEGVGVILLSLADWRATRGPLVDERKRARHERVMLKLIEHYFRQKTKIPLPKIIDGYDVMRKFNLSPSPIIGQILRKVKEEQALGKISTKGEAYKVARKVIVKKRIES